MEYYKKLFELAEQLVSETGMVEDRRNLSVSYNDIGDIYQAQGNLPLALEYYIKSLEIFDQLASETGMVKSRRDLSVSYGKLGDIYRAQGDLPQSLEYYEKSLEIREQLAEETGTIGSYDDLASSYAKIGFVTEGDEQQHYFRLAYDIYCRLAEACPGVARYAEIRDLLKEYLDD